MKDEILFEPGVMIAKHSLETAKLIQIQNVLHGGNCLSKTVCLIEEVANREECILFRIECSLVQYFPKQFVMSVDITDNKSSTHLVSSYR